MTDHNEYYVKLASKCLIRCGCGWEMEHEDFDVVQHFYELHHETSGIRTVTDNEAGADVRKMGSLKI